MNWNSHSVDAVAKERIWKEHVLNEKNTARVHDQFRCNPLRKDPPTAESISKRPARFLDRSAVIMDMLEKRLQRVKKNEEGGNMIDSARYYEFSSASARNNNNNNNNDNNTNNNTSGRTQLQQTYQLQTRGMYSFNDGSSPRGMQAKEKLPPLNNNNSSSVAAAAGAGGKTLTNNNNTNIVSPRTKRSLAAHDFDGLYSQAQLTPREKYATPQTAMQEIGWWNQNLISQKELEPRFRYGLSSCDVTKNGSAFVGSRRK